MKKPTLSKKQAIESAEKVGITPKPISVVQKRTFLERRHLFNISAIVATLALSILIVLAHINPYFEVDLETTRLLQSFHYTPVHQLMYLVSLPGNGIYKYLFLPIVFLLIYLRKRKLEGVMLLFSSLGAELVSLVLKHLVSRNRPDPKLITSVLHFDQPDSFPSGHVLFYVGFFGFLLFIVYTLTPKSWTRTFLLLVCLVFIFLIGPSRIYLGAHWFSDVLGAYLAGFLWVFVTVFIYSKRKK